MRLDRARVAGRAVLGIVACSVLAWLGLGAPGALAQADGERGEPALDGPVFVETIDVGLRQLYVTVVDWRGRLVRDLERDDFELRDAGRRQELVTFAAGDMPFSAMILIDASFSMAGSRLEAAIRGVETFTERMNELDLARLVAFSDQVRAVSEWSDDPAVVAEPLERLDGIGGSAVYDHLYLGLRLVHERAGRPVVILLSDGWDQQSMLDLDLLEDELELSDVQIYWLRAAVDVPFAGRTLGRRERRGEAEAVRVVPRSVWRGEREARDRYQRLEKLVTSSGGRALIFDDDAGLVEAFDIVLDELRAQYALGWYPEPEQVDGTWRELDVEVDGRARHRSGYLEGRRR